MDVKNERVPDVDGSLRKEADQSKYFFSRAKNFKNFYQKKVLCTEPMEGQKPLETNTFIVGGKFRQVNFLQSFCWVQNSPLSQWR